VFIYVTSLGFFILLLLLRIEFVVCGFGYSIQLEFFFVMKFQLYFVHLSGFWLCCRHSIGI
jgi:hypothetical protein